MDETKIVFPSDAGKLPTAKQLEVLYVEHVLTVTGGNKSKAARLLGFDRRTLYRKLDRRKPVAAAE